MNKQEPKIHSFITDYLEEDHPNAHKSVYCKVCNTMVHAFNNECMDTWIETGLGNYCMDCFAKAWLSDDELGYFANDDFGL